MPVELACPQCGKQLRVAENAAASRVQCPACGNTFLPKPASGNPASPASDNPWSQMAADQPANPFASPMVQSSGASYGDSDLATAGIKRALADTRPWVLFMAILIFIGCGLAGIGALAALFVSPFLGLIYIPFIALYFFAGYHLYNYSTGIKTFLRTTQSGDLQSALTAQKSFWKLVGIVTAVGFALWVLGFFLTIVAGVRWGQ